MTPSPTISIDTTNDTAKINVTNEDGSFVGVHHIKLGETDSLTMHQVEAKARALAKEALKAAIAAL